MDVPAYDKLLGLLDSAKVTLAAHADNLSPADLRIRCLVNITAKEAERALLETAANQRTPFSNIAAGPSPVTDIPAPLLSTPGSPASL